MSYFEQDLQKWRDQQAASAASAANANAADAADQQRRDEINARVYGWDHIPDTKSFFSWAATQYKDYDWNQYMYGKKPKETKADPDTNTFYAVKAQWEYNNENKSADGNTALKFGDPTYNPYDKTDTENKVWGSFYSKHGRTPAQDEFQSLVSQEDYNTEREQVKGLTPLKFASNLYNPKNYSDQDNEIMSGFINTYNHAPIQGKDDSLFNSYKDTYLKDAEKKRIAAQDAVEKPKFEAAGVAFKSGAVWKADNTDWTNRGYAYDAMNELDAERQKLGIAPGSYLNEYTNTADDNARKAKGLKPKKLENTDNWVKEYQDFTAKAQELAKNNQATDESIRALYSKYRTLNLVDQVAAINADKPEKEIDPMAELMGTAPQAVKTPVDYNVLAKYGYDGKTPVMSLEYIDSVKRKQLDMRMAPEIMKRLQAQQGTASTQGAKNWAMLENQPEAQGPEAVAPKSGLDKLKEIAGTVTEYLPNNIVSNLAAKYVLPIPGMIGKNAVKALDDLAQGKPLKFDPNVSAVELMQRSADISRGNGDEETAKAIEFTLSSPASKAIMGFLGEAATDPTTYIGASQISKVAKLFKADKVAEAEQAAAKLVQATKTETAVTGLDNLNPAAAELTDAGKLAKPPAQVIDTPPVDAPIDMTKGAKAPEITRNAINTRAPKDAAYVTAVTDKRGVTNYTAISEGEAVPEGAKVYAVDRQNSGKVKGAYDVTEQFTAKTRSAGEAATEALPTIDTTTPIDTTPTVERPIASTDGVTNTAPLITDTTPAITETAPSITEAAPIDTTPVEATRAWTETKVSAEKKVVLAPKIKDSGEAGPYYTVERKAGGKTTIKGYATPEEAAAAMPKPTQGAKVEVLKYDGKTMAQVAENPTLTVDPKTGKTLPVGNKGDARFDAQQAPPAGMDERGMSSNIRTDSGSPDALRDSYSQDPEFYKVVANADTLSKAQAVYNQGEAAARSELTRLNAAMKPEAVPLAKMLARDATKRGDVATARQLLSDVAVKLTEAGQFGQANRILRDADPETFFMTIEKQIKKLNTDGAKVYGKKWKDFDLLPAEADEIAKLPQGDEAAYNGMMEKIQARIADQMPATALEKLTAWRHMAMLLNPKTHLRNVLGNGLMMGIDRTANKVSAVLQKGLPQAQRTQAIVVKKETKALAAEFYAKHEKDLMSGANKYNEGIGLNIKDKRVFQNNTLEKVRKFNYAKLQDEDKFFFKRAYQDRLASAMQAQGIKSLDNIPQNVLDLATTEAEKAVFRDKSWLSNTISKAKQVKGLNVIVDTIMPFSKTPINIAKRGLDFSPVGMGKGIVKLFKKETRAEGIDDLAKGLTGTGVMGLGYLLASKGLLTGAADKDADMANYDKATGNAPFSFMGAESYDWAQPFAIPIAVGVAIYESLKQDPRASAKMQKAIETGDTETMNQLAGFYGMALLSGFKAAGDTMFNMSVLTGIQDLFGNPQGVMAGFAQLPANYVNQNIPTALGQIARTVDPTVRQTSYGGTNPFTAGYWQTQAATVANKIPGVSTLLEPKITPFGKEQTGVENPWLRGLQQFVNPGNLTTPQEVDPKVDAELRRLFEAGQVTQFPVDASPSFNFMDKAVNLNSTESADYKRTVGQETMKAFADIIHSEEYRAMPAADLNTKLKALAAKRGITVDALKKNTEIIPRLTDEYRAGLLAKAITYAKWVGQIEILKARGLLGDLTEKQLSDRLGVAQTSAKTLLHK